MLTTLRIKNLALVADLALEFQPGFNAITGETGAGKSILIGALNLLLGQRADRTLLRAGCESCTVEAALDLGRVRAPVAPWLAENGLEPCEGGQLLLKRSFTSAGANRQFINGSPASLQTLAELGEWLVDIHGPHDHQSLFHPARQLELLDAQAGLESAREAFAALYDRRQRVLETKAALVVDEATYARELDLLRHQVNEIVAARLQAGEEVAVEEEHHRAQNSARLLELTQGALGQVSESEEALLVQAGQVGRTLQDLVRLDPAAETLAALHARAVETLRELQGALSHYAERVEIDPERLAELDQRLGVLQSLRRKYGGTVADVLAFGENARQRLAQLEGRDGELVRLNAELAAAEAELKTSGARLSAARRKAIPDLGRGVVGQLRDLGFARSDFGVELTALTEPLRTGYDRCEFQFAPNPGEPSRPLRAIASSGELARVMLALKTVLAGVDDVPVLVFDEVDANIGGEIAHAVGEKMRHIGKRRQVLCITHLAPVAAASSAHYVASKSARDGRTVSTIVPVEGPERVLELSRMLGGGEAAKTHARSLLAGRAKSERALPPAKRGVE